MDAVVALGHADAAGRLAEAVFGALPARPTTVVALAAGDHHTCALVTGGGAYCWGNNYYGQLGTGGTSHRYTPTAVTGLGTGGGRMLLYTYTYTYIYI
jgi:alpha-tubulin suppressor-like RCC1 family protein